MNGFHVQAVGWVLVANARVLTPAEGQALSDLWMDLVQTRAADLREAHPVFRWLVPRSFPLSPATRAAMATLVDRMTAQHPPHFSEPALRRRRNHWAGQAVLGWLLSTLAAILVPPSWPQAAAVAPTFFAMGCGCLLPAVMLWRAARAVDACHAPNRTSDPLVRGPAHRFRGR